MSDIAVIEKPGFHALAVHRVVGTFALKKTMQPAFCTVMETIQEAGLGCPKGLAPFTRYNGIDWREMEKRGFGAMLRMMFAKKWDMDIGVPVDRKTEVQGEVFSLECRPGKCVRTLHVGPYAKVAEAYTRILKMARGQGLELADHSYELYLNDPCEVQSSELKTEILVPLA